MFTSGWAREPVPGMASVIGDTDPNSTVKARADMEAYTAAGLSQHTTFHTLRHSHASSTLGAARLRNLMLTA